jgi:hypothetical protein
MIQIPPCYKYSIEENTKKISTNRKNDEKSTKPSTFKLKKRKSNLDIKESTENKSVKTFIKKRKQKVSTKIYFTQETENAIIQYNLEKDPFIREKIYKEKIEYALIKLIENVFNRWKFTYFETSPFDVQKEALAHLVSNMGKYDPNKQNNINGKIHKNKAFSYFSVIAKNWFILLNNTNYKKFKQHVEISEERDENTIQLQHVDKHYAQVELNEFLNLTLKYWEKNAEKIFTKSKDLNIANAVIELLRNHERIELFNKKALYLYIREISNCKTQQITKVINKMKYYQKFIYDMYLNDGIISYSTHF